MTRKSKPLSWFGWLVFPSLLLVGCVHGSGGPAELNRTGRSLAAYFPLAVENRWTYQTWFREQPQPDLTVTIVKEEKGFFIDDRPTPGRIRIDGEGIRDGSVRFLLKTPLEKGAKWMSVADVRTVEHYEIVETGAKVSVPAGVFEDCVVVRMEVRITERRAMVNRMTFAPGVGIVDIRASFQEGTKQIPQSRMALKSYKIADSKSKD